jgi:hypothetical protein
MTTPRQNIEAALTTQGARDIPAVICYESIYVRDHWPMLTDSPWWHAHSPDLALQLAWRRDVLTRSGYDWFELPPFPARKERENLCLDVRADGVYRVDKRTGHARRLNEPRVGGWDAGHSVQSIHPTHMPENEGEVDARIPTAPAFDPVQARAEGRDDLARELIAVEPQYFPLGYVAAPLWQTYPLWGFEGMMEMIVERPQLVRHACERNLSWCLRAVREAAFLGAAGVWIEDCLTDMISPRDFESLNVPWLRRIVDEIRQLGMKSIYYFCGSPAGKWDMLLSIGADALALEESKKGFRIDIDEVVEQVGGRCAVLGNLDAIGVLQDGDEGQLRAAIQQQIAAGRRNGSRFIMSVGSPVTPGTPVERVSLYCDLSHEMGAS